MDYGNANARIKSMKSRLLDQQDLDELSNKPDIDSLIIALEDTAYRTEIQKAGIEFSGISQIETAIRRDLVFSFRQILRFFRGESDEAYIRILLNRFDVQNIKTVLRGKKIGAHHNEIIANLVPAGELGMAALSELTEQPDVRAVIDLLATWRIDYAAPLTRKLPAYLEKRDLAILEFALDQFYFDHALSILKEDESDDGVIVLEMIQTGIDVANLKIVLRIIRDRINVDDPNDYLIAGGKYIRIDQLAPMLTARSVEEFVRELADTAYAFLGDVNREDLVHEKLSSLERELERFIIIKGCRHFLRDPLSIAIPIGYIWAKENEITNIRIIARSIIGQVPEPELRRALTYV